MMEVEIKVGGLGSSRWSACAPAAPTPFKELLHLDVLRDLKRVTLTRFRCPSNHGVGTSS